MKLLSLARDLRRRKARERSGLFVAEGVRTVEALLEAGCRVRGALTSAALGETTRGAALRQRLAESHVAMVEVDQAAFASAAETDSPQGVLAVAEQPALTLESLAARFADADGGLRLLVLDGVQDPGNVGTLVRTSAGLGGSAVLALPGTVDLWSAKVIRSAMGAHFRLPTLPCTWDGLATFLQRLGAPLWAADGAGGAIGEAAAGAPPRLALVLGNEGAGLSAEARARADRLVAVPSTDLVESLNVAVAGSILLYELRPAGLRGRPAGGTPVSPPPAAPPR